MLAFGVTKLGDLYTEHTGSTQAPGKPFIEPIIDTLTGKAPSGIGSGVKKEVVKPTTEQEMEGLQNLMDPSKLMGVFSN